MFCSSFHCLLMVEPETKLLFDKSQVIFVMPHPSLTNYHIHSRIWERKILFPDKIIPFYWMWRWWKDPRPVCCCLKASTDLIACICFIISFCTILWYKKDVLAANQRYENKIYQYSSVKCSNLAPLACVIEGHCSGYIITFEVK